MIDESEDRQKQIGQLNKHTETDHYITRTDWHGRDWDNGPLQHTTECLCPPSVCITSVPLTACSWHMQTHTHVHRHTHISDLPGWTRACTHPHSRFAFCHTSTYHVPCRLRAPRQSLCMWVCLKERKTEGVRPHVCVWVNEDEWMNGLLLDCS